MGKITGWVTFFFIGTTSLGLLKLISSWVINKPSSVLLAQRQSFIWIDSYLPILTRHTRKVCGPLHPFPIRSCSVWGLLSRPVTWPLVRSYRTFPPLPQKNWGSFLFYALSLRSPPLDVIQHTALWSPDFPHTRQGTRLSFILITTYVL